MAWAKYLVAKEGPIDTIDVKLLFDLAIALEQELTKAQADETTQWIAEFNSGISLLESAIKSQRDDTDKKLDTIRTSLATHDASLKTEEAAKLAGALEVTLAHPAEARAVSIAIDQEAPVDFLGPAWSRMGLSPGQHRLTVGTHTAPPQSIQRVVEIPAAGVARVEIRLPG